MSLSKIDFLSLSNAIPLALESPKASKSFCPITFGIGCGANFLANSSSLSSVVGTGPASLWNAVVPSGYTIIGTVPNVVGALTFSSYGNCNVTCCGSLVSAAIVCASFTVRVLNAPAGPPNRAPPNAPKPAAAPTPFSKLVSGNTSCTPTCLANAPPPSSIPSDIASPISPLVKPPVRGKPLPTNARSIVLPPGRNAVPIDSPAASNAATRALAKAIPCASSSGVPRSRN